MGSPSFNAGLAVGSAKNPDFTVSADAYSAGDADTHGVNSWMFGTFQRLFPLKTNLALAIPLLLINLLHIPSDMKIVIVLSPNS